MSEDRLAPFQLFVFKIIIYQFQTDITAFEKFMALHIMAAKAANVMKVAAMVLAAD